MRDVLGLLLVSLGLFQSWVGHEFHFSKVELLGGPEFVFVMIGIFVIAELFAIEQE